MKSCRRALGWVAVLILTATAPAAAKPGYGKLSGVVLDPSGTPQMGATVWIIAENEDGRTVSHLLTNEHGVFSSDGLKPGKYEVRVSLTGYLPALERDIGVSANLTTLLRVQVDSIFASLDGLRRQPNVAAEPDDWKWVLRSATSTRTVLQLRDGTVDLADPSGQPESPRNQRPRVRVELTSGSSHPGSPSNLPAAAATAISYDQPLGSFGRVLLAGQMSYDEGASGAFSGIWLPSGVLGRGPETTVVMRRTTVGPNGLAFEGTRLDHSEEFALGSRMSLRAGAELLRVGILSSVSALRPHARLDANLTPSWTASFEVAASPTDTQLESAGALQSAIADLDSLPTVMFRDGHPVLESAWHEEIAINHKLTERGSFEAAAFHEAGQHEIIYGTGPVASPDFFRDPFSNAFLYDGGETDSWGARLAYRQKIAGSVEIAAVYAWAGALSPTGDLNLASADLRDRLVTRYHHSLAARLSGRVPRTGTQLAASYKWIAGTALTQQDGFGEAEYQLDPNLHLSIRQPLPGFGLGHRWEALADFTNLLAQGYVPVNGQDSRFVLVPVLRSFRGGVSFQF